MSETINKSNDRLSFLNMIIMQPRLYQQFDQVPFDDEFHQFRTALQSVLHKDVYNNPYLWAKNHNKHELNALDGFKTKNGRRYTMHYGWQFGILTNESFYHSNDVWNKWITGYHGTSISNIDTILRSKTMLKPGDCGVDNKFVGIGAGHIQLSFVRTNLFTNKSEIFNPRQIFASPSVSYASLYAEQFSFENRDYKLLLKIKIADCVGIGQQTVYTESVAKTINIDKHIPNNQLEYYSLCNQHFQIYGLVLIRM
eukprot:273331_1